jgi:hypothetical protein
MGPLADLAVNYLNDPASISTACNFIYTAAPSIGSWLDFGTSVASYQAESVVASTGCLTSKPVLANSFSSFNDELSFPVATRG